MQNNKKNKLVIPNGRFSVDEDPLEKKRKELKKKLEEAKKVSITPTGSVNPDETTNTGNNIQIPPGKLAVEDKATLTNETLLQKEKIQEIENQILRLRNEVDFIKSLFHIDLIREHQVNMWNNIQIPNNPISDADLKRKRDELKKKLAETKNAVTISTGGNPIGSNETGNNVQIPEGELAVEAPSEKKRKELKKKLEEAKSVSISPTGNVSPDNTTNTGNNIQIPPGKLANFYWYKSDPELYQAEIAAMNKYFPNFTLEEVGDGRLCWTGEIQPKLLGNHSYHLMLVYDNNHPNNSSYGGSVKCYLVSPEIEEMEAEVGRTLPHILGDSQGRKYLCTSEKDNFKASTNYSLSASSCLAWAVKWIAVYELFVGGEVTYEEFAGHGRF